jgi:hypothetical protein
MFMQILSIINKNVRKPNGFFFLGGFYMYRIYKYFCGNLRSFLIERLLDDYTGDLTAILFLVLFLTFVFR